MNGRPSKLPAGWRTVQVRDVAEQCLGKMLDGKKNKGRPLPYLRNPNVRWFEVDLNDLREMPFEDHELERYGLRSGDVLVCEGGEAGRAAIWDGRVATMKFQKAIHRLRPGPSLLNRFFVYQLQADCQNGRLADYYTGATIKHLTGQDLARYTFALPPLVEQQRIVDVLDRADALRVKRRATVAETNALAQAIFADLFGDPATNQRKWPLSTVGSVATQVTDGEHVTPKRAAVGIKLLSARNIRDGRLDLRDVDFIDIAEHQRIKRRCNPSRGDVLISCSGTIGRVVLLDTDESFSMVRSVAMVRPAHEVVDSKFLEHQLRTPALLALMLRRANASSQANLFQHQIRELPIFLPPMELQRRFAKHIAALSALETKHRRSLAELDKLFASLQHRAFRGEL